MAMSTLAKIGIAASVVGGVLALASSGSGGGKQGSGAPPQRVPSVPPGKPAQPSGEQRNNDQGRTWGTFYVNRNEYKHYELKVLSVASSPGNAAIGTGEVVVDVYETIVPSADWQWQGQSCEATRWILKFSAGHLLSSKVFSVGDPPCQSVRPPFEVWGRKLHWIQIGSNVFLVLDTASGLNHRSPDKMIKARQNFSDKSISENRPGKYAGTGAYDGKRDNPQWYNGNVSSGYVTLDASWIFTKTGAA